MMLQRFYDAIMAGKERKRTRLRKLIYSAMPYYDSTYMRNWSMDSLIKRILEITDGKK